MKLGIANPTAPNYSILAAGSYYAANSSDLFAVANSNFAGPAGIYTLKAGPRDIPPPNSNIYPVFST